MADLLGKGVLSLLQMGDNGALRCYFDFAMDPDASPRLVRNAGPVDAGTDRIVQISIRRGL